MSVTGLPGLERISTEPGNPSVPRARLVAITDFSPLHCMPVRGSGGDGFRAPCPRTFDRPRLAPVLAQGSGPPFCVPDAFAIRASCSPSLLPCLDVVLRLGCWVT